MEYFFFFLTSSGQDILNFVFVIYLATEKNSPAHHTLGFLAELWWGLCHFPLSHQKLLSSQLSLLLTIMWPFLRSELLCHQLNWNQCLRFELGSLGTFKKCPCHMSHTLRRHFLCGQISGWQCAQSAKIIFSMLVFLSFRTRTGYLLTCSPNSTSHSLWTAVSSALNTFNSIQWIFVEALPCAWHCGGHYRPL